MSSAPQLGAPPTFVVSRWLFLRLLGVVYLIAFVSVAVQVTGLVGEHGILPAGRFLEWARATYGHAAYRLFPTLCWLGATDAALKVLSWGGAVLAVLAIAGVAPVPVLALLWLFYLSLTVVGQTFLFFQWDELLLETGLLAIFYTPSQWLPSLTREHAPSPLMRWLVVWLLFRLTFLSGITKLASGDPTWLAGTALDYHFETQPLPPWTAWYAHHLPAGVHRAATIGMLFAELVVPWLVFAPLRLRRVRLAACAGLVLFQLLIEATGNYGFFNALAIVLCVPLLDDDVLRRVLPLRLSVEGVEPKAKRAAVRLVAAIVLPISALTFVREIAYTLPGGRAGFPGWADGLVRAVAPLRSINGYGLFRVMTTERPEIVIEGSRDGAHWSEYRFRWKPSAVTGRPRFVAPYHPRLDWQMWFAALDPPSNEPWLESLVRRLLEGSPQVLSLLDGNPFPDAPPRYVRLAYYRYRFSTAAVRSRTGAWWERAFKGYLTPPLSR